jgi:hypothetical protein
MRGQVTLCKEIVAIITAFAVERSVRWGDTSGGRGGPLMAFSMETGWPGPTRCKQIIAATSPQHTSTQTTGF